MISAEEKLERLEEIFRPLAEKKNSFADYDADEEPDLSDYAGGNIDDAFQIGYTCSEVESARTVVSIIEK